MTESLGKYERAIGALEALILLAESGELPSKDLLSGARTALDEARGGRGFPIPPSGTEEARDWACRHIQEIEARARAECQPFVEVLTALHEMYGPESAE